MAVYSRPVSVLRTIVSSSRALVTGAKDVARFREIATVFVRHGFGWFFAQLKLRRELQVDYDGASFKVPGNSSFDIEVVGEPYHYVCHFA